MITRIEIDGFKTFQGFALDIPPFMVILGKNASGKSNLFDSIQFLRLTSSGSLLEAVQNMRGDLSELFHRRTDGSFARTMSFAVEVLLAPYVSDDFGDTVEVRHSRLRYELELELRPVKASGSRHGTTVGRGERMYVSREAVKLIRQPTDRWLAEAGIPPNVRKFYAKYSSRSSDLLLETTKDENDRTVFAIHQEGRSGKPRLLPAMEAGATVLSSLTTTEFPLLYALKREFESWRLLHLDPGVLRSINSYDDDDVLASNGANLANALKRILDQTATEERPDGILDDLSADLARIIPGAYGIELDEDDSRRQRHVVVLTRDEAPFTARVASDGTLRAIALLAALYDPRNSGLICFEEPENGIYPQRLVEFVRQLRSLVERSMRERRIDPDAPLMQLMLSSHSPIILKALGADHGFGINVLTPTKQLRNDVVFVDTATRTVPGGPKSRVTRVRKLRANDQGALDFASAGIVVPQPEIESFEVWEQLG